MTAPTLDRAAELLANDAAYGAFADAMYRLDNLPLTRDEVMANRETVRRYELAQVLADRDAKTPPNACAECGLPERGHGTWWRADGRHTFVAPSDSLRLLRLKARRDAADRRLWLAVARRFETRGEQA